MTNKYTIIKYGTHFESKDEAVERVYKSLHRGHSTPCVRVNYYNDCPLFVVDGKLYYNSDTAFKNAFTGDNWEAPEVLDIVEARIVKELEEYRIAEEARKKKEEEEAIARAAAERKAEQERKDAEKKAQYNSWKAEAERLGIPFADLCAMKRAKMEEDMYDDWDD